MSIIAKVDVRVRIEVLAENDEDAKAEALSRIVRGMSVDDEVIDVTIVSRTYAGGE